MSTQKNGLSPDALNKKTSHVYELVTKFLYYRVGHFVILLALDHATDESAWTGFILDQEGNERLLSGAAFAGLLSFAGSLASGRISLFAAGRRLELLFDSGGGRSAGGVRKLFGRGRCDLWVG